MKNKKITYGRSLCLLLALFAVSSFLSLNAGNIIYVDGWSLSPTDGDGKSWESPFKSWESAMGAAEAGDEIWVAGGELSEDGTQIVAIEYKGSTFLWKEGVNVYGGFNVGKGAGTKETRDPVQYPAVLLGDGTGSVLFPSNFEVNTYIDGFTIKGGGKSDLTTNGAGAYLRNGAHLVNCIITGNTAKAGGGVNLDGRDLKVDGQMVDKSHLIPSVERCTIHSNRAAATGAGVNITYKGVVKDCIIINNTATTSSGGGVGVSGSAFPAKVINCVIANNDAANNGGGVWASGGEFINCTIVNNIARNTDMTNDGKGNGGGVLLDSKLLDGVNHPTVLKNCIVWGNTTQKSINAGGSELHKKQIYHGKGDLTKGDIYTLAIEDLATANSVLLQVPADRGSFSLGASNTAADGPNFVHPASQIGLFPDYSGVDWSIGSASALINKGNNEFNTELLDIAGNARIQDNIIDLGAYEFNAGSSITNTTIEEQVAYMVGTQLFVKADNAEVSVFTTTGASVMSVNNQSVVDLTILKSGLYIVRIAAAGQVSTLKVVRK